MQELLDERQGYRRRIFCISSARVPAALSITFAECGEDYRQRIQKIDTYTSPKEQHSSLTLVPAHKTLGCIGNIMRLHSVCLVSHSCHMYVCMYLLNYIMNLNVGRSLLISIFCLKCHQFLRSPGT